MLWSVVLNWNQSGAAAQACWADSEEVHEIVRKLEVCLKIKIESEDGDVDTIVHTVMAWISERTSLRMLW
jgi:hypothetical protein